MDELFRPLYALGAHLRHFTGCDWSKVQKHQQREINRYRDCHSGNRDAPVVRTTGRPEARASYGQPQPASASRRR